MTALALTDGVRLLVDGPEGDPLNPRDDAPGWTRDELRKLEVLAEFRTLTPHPWCVLRWQQQQRDLRHSQQGAWIRERWAHTTGAEREAMIADARETKEAWWAKLTEAERTAHLAKEAARAKARVVSLSPEAREDRKRIRAAQENARRAAWTPEQRAKQLAKEAQRRAARTPEQLAARKDYDRERRRQRYATDDAWREQEKARVRERMAKLRAQGVKPLAKVRD